MGKLAIQLSLAVLCIGLVIMVPSFILPWTQVKSIGVTGTSDASFSLWHVKVKYKWSIKDKIMKKVSGKMGKEYDTYTLFNDCEKPMGNRQVDGHECVFWLSDLYLSSQATSEFGRLFGLNGVLGQEWQMNIVFWAGMINILLLIVGVVCGVMSAAYLYFYMEGKFNPKLRKIGSYYMAGCLFCLFMALIVYMPVLVFLGVDSHGQISAMIPGVRQLQGKGLVPGSAIFFLGIACILVGGALASQGSWKTESGEWKRERHKMKHEFEKWMDSSSSDETDEWSEEDSDWESDDGHKKKKKKSKKK